MKINKNIGLFLSLLLCLACAEDLAMQPDSTLTEQDYALKDSDQANDIFMVVEEQPTFDGGMQAWNEYLKGNLKYPAAAKENGIEGQVFVTFVVDEEGAISDAQIVRGIGGGCDEEALRVIQASPNWIPGKNGGREVKTRMQVRMVFRTKDSNRQEQASPTNNAASPQVDPADVYMVVDEQATFPGGMSDWSEYLKSNLKYPSAAKEQGIEGAVFITFIVGENGEILQPQIVRGIGGGCDEEALRVIKESPNWLPGKKDGAVVKSRMQVRMLFKI
jgi:TonB family protein